MAFEVEKSTDGADCEPVLDPTTGDPCLLIGVLAIVAIGPIQT